MKALGITGSTLTTALGAGRAATLTELQAGRTGLAPARFMDVALPTWTGEVPEADAVTVKLYDVANAALTPDGETLALATRGGGVSVTVARPGVPRVNPEGVGGHDAPVTGLAFSQKERWLASLAEKVWIWSY